MEEGEVVLGLAVAAGGDPALPFQPGVGALDRPAVAGLRVGRPQSSLGAAADLAHRRPGRDRLAAPARLRDAGLDPALAERLLELAAGVAAVGPQLLRADATPGEGVEEREQVPTLVLVAGGEADLEREPARVDR